MQLTFTTLMSARALAAAGAQTCCALEIVDDHVAHLNTLGLIHYILLTQYNQQMNTHKTITQSTNTQTAADYTNRQTHLDVELRHGAHLAERAVVFERSDVVHARRRDELPAQRKLQTRTQSRKSEKEEQQDNGTQRRTSTQSWTRVPCDTGGG